MRAVRSKQGEGVILRLEERAVHFCDFSCLGVEKAAEQQEALHSRNDRGMQPGHVQNARNYTDADPLSKRPSPLFLFDLFFLHKLSRVSFFVCFAISTRSRNLSGFIKPVTRACRI